jgi:hypothetical protein
LHAFGDSDLYLRQARDRLQLSSEHRAAPAPPPVYLELVAADPEAIHLTVIAEPDGQPGRELPEPVLALRAEGTVLTRGKLRDALSVKNERLGEVLETLEQITMEEVLNLLIFEALHRAGDQWSGRWPLHESKPGRQRHFSVNVGIRRYHCHKCQSKSNQREFWQAFTKLQLHTAMIDLCGRLGREVLAATANHQFCVMAMWQALTVLRDGSSAETPGSRWSDVPCNRHGGGLPERSSSGSYVAEGAKSRPLQWK